MPRSKPEKLGRTRGKRRSSKARLGRTAVSRGGMRASWSISTDLAPSLDAVALVDHVSDAVLAEHYLAIKAGERAEGPQKQPQLLRFGRAGREAAEGKRPDIRGVTGSSTRPFAENLERSKITTKGTTMRRTRLVRGVRALEGQSFVVNETVEATRAKTTIQPDRIHRNFVAFEDGREIQYLFVTGYVAEVVDRAVARWFLLGLEGVLKKGDRRDRKAARAKTK